MVLSEASTAQRPPTQTTPPPKVGIVARPAVAATLVTANFTSLQLPRRIDVDSRTSSTLSSCLVLVSLRPPLASTYARDVAKVWIVSNYRGRKYASSQV